MYFFDSFMKGLNGNGVILYNYRNLVYLYKKDNTFYIVSDLKLKLSNKVILSNKITFKNMLLTNILLESFDVSDARSLSYMFKDCSLLNTVTFRNFDTSRCVDMVGMFQLCYRLKNVNIEDLDLSAVEMFNSMFLNCVSLDSLNIQGKDLTSVTHFCNMFAKCKYLNNLNFDTCVLDMEKVEYWGGMFYDCAFTNTESYMRFLTKNNISNSIRSKIEEENRR